MRKNNSEISAKLSETWSRNSSRFKSFSYRYSSKTKAGRNPPISRVQTRRNLKIFDDGTEVTPKDLSHPFYPEISRQQFTAFDLMGLWRSDSNMMSMGSGLSNAVPSTSSLIGSINNHAIIPSFDENIESFFSMQEKLSIYDDKSRAPSPFCLPRFDESLDQNIPEKLTITLKETETIIIFEMPQLTANLDTPEGQKVKEENERYEYITVGPGSNRKLANAETQTVKIYTKTRATHLSRHKRQNTGTCVNNWIMYDTYNDSEPTEKIPEISQERHKLPTVIVSSELTNPDDQLKEIYKKTNFQDAAQVMERIIASNLFIKSHKRFKGLIKQDPCDLNLKFTYNLDLLWTHSFSKTKNHSVTSFKWNYKNKNVLAVGYGPQSSEILLKNQKSEKSTTIGYVLIWCMKNPSQPDRIFSFDSPISDLDWSQDKPNQLAIGFYNGSIKVIDVSTRDLTILRKTNREDFQTFSPLWQIQWWPNNIDSNQGEQIYASNQDGGIYCFRTGEDFTSTEIMRIPKIEATIQGVKKTKNCLVYDITIRKNPGAVLLRPHPISKNVYFVGSDEGCVYECSTNYLNHHTDSFLAHDGEIYSFEFSPFCSKLFLTCGADWCTRIWAEGLTQPLITLTTKMACVRAAVWSPTNSTIIATCVNNEISIWDIKRKTYEPTSVTIISTQRITMLKFTENGQQLIAADIYGIIYVLSLEGMPFPPYDQTFHLIKSIEKNLATKPDILKKFNNLDGILDTN